MPNPTTYSAPTNIVPITVEGLSEANRLTVRGHTDPSGIENVLTGPGLAAVLATLSTYYSGLTTAQINALLAANNGVLLHVTAPHVTAAVRAVDHSTVAASLATNVKASGNISRG